MLSGSTSGQSCREWVTHPATEGFSADTFSMVRPPGFVWPERECVYCGISFSPTGATQRRCRSDCAPDKQHCYECSQVKSVEEFYRRPDGSVQTPCKECRRGYARDRWHAKDREWHARTAETHWQQNLQRRFKLSVEDYWRMFDGQGGRCRICRRSVEDIDSQRFRRLSVDHDRQCCPGQVSCGKCVRGLLCVKCNGALGWYEQFAVDIAAYLANGGS